MKTLKINISILLVLISIGFVNAQIKPAASLETGYNKYTHMSYVHDISYKEHRIDVAGLYSDICIGANFKGIKLTANVLTYYVDKANSYQFSPWMSTYKIGLEYTYKKITIGANHYCTHLVTGAKYYELEVEQYNVTEEKIFIKWTICN